MKNKMWGYIEEQKEVMNHILNKESELLSFLPQYQNIKEIIIAASGSSLNAAMLAAGLVSHQTEIRLTVDTPFHLRNETTLLQTHPQGKLLIVLSQTGKSVSTLECIPLAKSHHIPVLALTADRASPIACQADVHVPVLCGEEPVGPKTKGFSASVLTLHLILMHLTKDSYHDQIIIEYQKSIQDLPVNISDTLKWCTAHQQWAKAEVMSVVGFGVHHATAREGSLKLLETMQMPVMNFEMEEFMHGPHRTIISGAYVILIDSDGAGKDLMEHLIDFTKSKTENYLVLSQCREADDHMIHVNPYSLTKSWFNLIVPFQIMCTYFPEVNGINSSDPVYGDFAVAVGTRMA